MNISISKNDKTLVLNYFPSKSDAWIDEHLSNNEPIPLKCDSLGCATFLLTREDFIGKEDNAELGDVEFTDMPLLRNHIWHFQLGVLEPNGYYRILARIVSSAHDVLIHEMVDVQVDFFLASVLNTRIMPIIDKMINTPLIIGGDAEGALPVDEYKMIIKRIPTRRELHLYAQSRIEGILAEYIPDTRESSVALSMYINRRYDRAKLNLGKVRVRDDTLTYYMKEIDCMRIKFTLRRLQELLGDVKKFTEQQWQTEIEKIILLLFPWYMAKIPQLNIDDSLDVAHNRRIDLALVSMTGNVDIVEIKRPDNCPLLSRKPNYRGNYIPSRGLSAAVMQAEKYLLNLERWGRDGERKIAVRIGVKKVQIRSPKAIIILGRSAELDCEQKKSDFEIIKRKFANVIDVVTYDDLAERLQNVLAQLDNK